MSNPHQYLPPETLDCIIDLLHDEPATLKDCCLVSKLWVPRTRKHLFANIELLSVKDIHSWKKAFPDPSISPAYHTHTLSVCWTQAVTEADTWAGGLIQTFPRVIRLKLTRPTLSNDVQTTLSTLREIPFAPFYKFSPTLKSLHVNFIFLPCVQIFDLVCSSPLLEDLVLFGHGSPFGDVDSNHGTQVIGPSTSPALTGSLDLHILGGMGTGYATRRLLDLPNGLYFRKFVFSWSSEEDLRWMLELVAKCSDTLECLDVERSPPCAFVLVLRWSNG